MPDLVSASESWDCYNIYKVMPRRGPSNEKYTKYYRVTKLQIQCKEGTVGYSNAKVRNNVP